MTCNICISYVVISSVIELFVCAVRHTSYKGSNKKKIMEKLSIYTEDENIHMIKILLIIIHVFTYYLQSNY